MISTDRTRARSSLTFNMAPMIDVVFLLIIFFVLVSTFTSSEQIPMELPDPEHSRAKNVKLTDRVIINVALLDPSDPQNSGIGYGIASNRVDSLGAISERLMVQKRINPELKVVIRADRRVPYGAVRDVMQIVAENGIEMMNIVAHIGDAGSDL